MHLILIPLFIIAILVGISSAGDLLESGNFSLPKFGDSEFNIRQFLGPKPNQNSPIEELGKY